MSAEKVIALRPGGAGRPEADPEPALADRSDDDLMLLARGGREGSFDALVIRHQRYVLCLASKYLADKSLVRDVAQSSFIELYRLLPRYSPLGRFKQLLSRIVLNQCRMAGRARANRRSALETYDRDRALDASALPDERIIARERRKAVDNAVARLSDKLRAVVVLRFAGGHPYQEIAEILDISVGTVKSRLAAGVDKLRELVEDGP